jgi:two-component system, response regulator PdtaR
MMEGRPRILLVEDEGLLAASLVEDLEQLGYSVKAVNSGEKALSVIREDPPDLVLMDIKLKGRLDGIQASAQIQSEHGIPLIYLTAHSDKSFLERAKLTEPFGYLIKPVSQRDLNNAIEIALYRSSADKERKQLLAKLQQALAEVKKLEGLLPICSYCKKIRDAGGNWQRVEQYISDHSPVQFTHSICPECLREHYPEAKPDSDANESRQE